MKQAILFFLLLVSAGNWAQLPAKGYFGFPIQPGQQNYLAGSFAELRPNHFHAGLDIKTAYREGLDVHAAAEGYISRVWVSTNGYGNAIFITHPNGYVSVYGHLKRFNERLAAYVRQQQYKRQSFEIDLQPAKNEFPVSKGEVIALSGNTGNSAGPHLHFEIRNERGRLVDPQKFSFPELVDDVPPVISLLALRPLDINSRLNGLFERKEFEPIHQPDGRLTLRDTITATGTLGLDLLAFDRANGTTNQNGLSCVEVHLDGEEIHVHNLESLPLEMGREMNVHTDYAMERLTGQHFQHCYVADGNDQLPIYPYSPTRGRLVIRPGSVHHVVVTVWDSYQNKNEVEFWIKGIATPLVETFDSLTTNLLPLALSQSIDENTLILKARNTASATPAATFFLLNNLRTTVVPTYRNGKELVYLWDLRRGLPDSVRVETQSLPLGFKRMMIPGKSETAKGTGWAVNVPATALYDTLFLSILPTPDGWQLGPMGSAFREPIRVGFSPPLADSLRSRTGAYVYDGSAGRYAGGTWQGGMLSFTTSDVGSLVARRDTVSPVIRPLTINPDEMRFFIKDDLSGIRSFRARVDSQWVLMNYEFKNGQIWSEKLDDNLPFSGPIHLEVTDNSGNTAIFSADFQTPFPAPRPQKPKVKAVRKKR